MGSAATAEPAAEPQAAALDIDAMVAAFEARCDKSDPAQLTMLEEMKQHTRRLHQARGDWNKPNARRNWNSAAKRQDATAPLQIASYR
jgi:hypothetical protein